VIPVRRTSDNWIGLVDNPGLVSQTMALDDAHDASDHTLKDPLQLLGLRRWGGVKPTGRFVVGRPVGPIEDQRVEVDVEVQRPAESLHVMPSSA